MDHLGTLESESITLLREAFNKIERPGMPWSVGKDSNTLVWLAMKAFFGRVPFRGSLAPAGTGDVVGRARRPKIHPRRH